MGSSQITARDHRDFSSVDGIIITSIATFPSSSVSLFVSYREDGGFGGPHHLVVDGGSTGSLFAPTSGSPPPSSPPRPVDVTSLLQHARPATARTREHFPLQCPSTQLALPPREDGV